MIKIIHCIAALLVLCGATPALADSLPSGWQSHKFNGPNQPTAENGVVTFQIFDRQCSDILYGDGRGESDCTNGNVRSVINKTGPREQLGQTIEYRFDLWIDPSLSLRSFRNPEAVGILPGGIDSRLRLASWEGPYLHNFIYNLKADADNGITFLGEQCQPASDFGKWVTFSMKIRWANDERGWIKVSCDDKIIYADEAVATNQAPQCFSTNVCEPGVYKDPHDFNFVLGPVLYGYGWNYADFGFESPFVDMQPEGITVRTRNMQIIDGAELYGPEDTEMVRELQNALNALGCDVGSADGIVGPKTRAAALACRTPEGFLLPEKLTVASLPEFLAFYTSDDVAAQPTGTEESTPARIAIDSFYSEIVGSGDTVLNVLGRATTTETISFNFLLIGRFSTDGRATRLELMLGDDLGDTPDTIRGCGFSRFERWGDGTNHVVLTLIAHNTTYQATTADCLIDGLPSKLATQARFLLQNFADVASEAQSEDLLRFVEQEGVRAFMSRIASGDLSVGM